MKKVAFREIDGTGTGWYGLVGILGLCILAGLGTFAYIEHEGHGVTGMTNQFAWSGGHVFSVFLIAAGAGAFVVAAAGMAFDRSLYKPLAPLAGIVAISLLMGGLAVMVLDLGRPDRLVVAMTNFNFKSTLASNIMRYNGFIGLVALVLWTVMDRRMACWVKPVAIVAFLWSLTLSTGVGLEFAFLVAREAYDAAILGPMMVAMSFTYGTAILTLVLIASFALTGRELGSAVLAKLSRLLALFVAAVLYFLFVFHLTTAYGTEHHGFVSFILADAGGITAAFWWGVVILGGIVPLAMLYLPSTGANPQGVSVACGLIVLGGLCQMYVLLIGGQSYPLALFPGMEVSSSFFDGAVNSYSPTFVEFVLAVTCVPMALIMIAALVKFLPVLPETLADSVVDPHYQAPVEEETEEAA